MKKIFKSFLATICVLAVSVMSFALVACGDPQNGGGNESNGKDPETGSKVFINTPITADADYVKDCDQKGTVVEHTYTAEAYMIEEKYNLEAGSVELEKTLYVYTPYGYDESKKYNVFYLQHGGGENEGYWFAKGSYADEKDSITRYGRIGNKVLNILDNLIKDGKIDPMIVVCGSFYPTKDAEHGNGTAEYPLGGKADGTLWTTLFYKELKNDILPFVQQNYSTYAESATPEGFTAARDHFGYLGFSMGSMIGYSSVMKHALDYFSYIGTASAKCDTSVDELVEIVTVGKFKDYKINYWYCATGEWDKGPDKLKQYEELLPRFGSKVQEGDDISKGDNCYFNSHKEGGHEFWCWEADLYNCLQVFFKATK